MNELTYGDLPVSPPAYIAIICSDAGELHGSFSAHRGDYFWAPGSEVIRCECGEPMTLVEHFEGYREVSR